MSKETVRILLESSKLLMKGTSLVNLQASVASAIGKCSTKSPFVCMIGEASHGTEEFYHIRAELTKQLITEHGFNFVAVEGDFPDCERLNRYVRGTSSDADATTALGDFKRFPGWMWRNHLTKDFLEWLKTTNEAFLREGKPQVGFHGLDMYSLHTSMNAVLEYLKSVDAKLAEQAQELYSGLLGYEDAQDYSRDFISAIKNEEKNVLKVLQLLLENRLALETKKGDGERYFTAEQNAKLVKSAEAYYRSLYFGGKTGWNIRDQHMFDMLLSLVGHYAAASSGTTSAPPVKAVIWEHNSHLGDNRFTEFGAVKEHNVGQLCRQGLGLTNTLNIGFSTFSGTVSAAARWGGKRHTFNLNEGLPESYEHLFHEIFVRAQEKHAELEGLYMIMRTNAKEEGTNAEEQGTNVRELASEDALQRLMRPRIQRAIGVQYVKRTERQSHYIKVILPKQFDVYIHIDKTTFLRPIEADSD